MGFNGCKQIYKIIIDLLTSQMTIRRRNKKLKELCNHKNM